MWCKRIVLWVILFRAVCPTEVVQISQNDSVISAQLGQSVTLKCTFTHDSQSYLFWYKQKPGEMPMVMAVAISSIVQFQNGFSASDYTGHMAEGVFNLTIKKTTASDEAFYFCAFSKAFHAVFGNGTYVALTDHRNPALDLSAEIKTSALDRGQQETLDCAVLTDSRTKDLRMFWFRPASDGSHPVRIYIQNNCSGESGSHAQSCIYRLPVGHTSDSRTFYCAVALYGHLLTGNRVMVDNKRRASILDSMDPVISGLAAALVLCIIAIIFLACLSCKRRCKDSKAHLNSSHTSPRTQSLHQGYETEGLNYASMHFKEGKGKSVRKNKQTPQESTYSDIRSSRS